MISQFFTENEKLSQTNKIDAMCSLRKSFAVRSTVGCISLSRLKCITLLFSHSKDKVSQPKRKRGRMAGTGFTTSHCKNTKKQQRGKKQMEADL